MKVSITEVESGFRNVRNGVTLTENLVGVQRDNVVRALDTTYIAELPDDYEIAETSSGRKAIYRGAQHVTLIGINHGNHRLEAIVGSEKVLFRITPAAAAPLPGPQPEDAVCRGGRPC